MNYGSCIFCGTAVTEEDSWGQEDQEYPPKRPYHTKCRQQRGEERGLAELVTKRIVTATATLDVAGDPTQMDELLSALKSSGMREFVCKDCGAPGLTRKPVREIDRCPPCDEQVEA